ncbi:hypothetical protein ACUXCC_005266 [Cytobacillus horneckiae]|uniref:hypothetical protein n=1 Tax=Cytobacillus horneckiae TaxID=549687 RepID=UPI0019D19874|nr:hypothetical protein [Cytobacillus horneckiae]MBN6889802.1 hypothetical protein [Cytobacillus horneckiae]
MPKQSLYYDYIGGQLSPYLYVLTFQSSEIDWNKSIFPYQVIKPFVYEDTFDLDDSIITSALMFSDFIFNNDTPDIFKLNLKKIKSRITEQGIDPYIVNQFVLPVYGLNEMLEMLPQERVMSLLIGGE